MEEDDISSPKKPLSGRQPKSNSVRRTHSIEEKCKLPNLTGTDVDVSESGSPETKGRNSVSVFAEEQFDPNYDSRKIFLKKKSSSFWTRALSKVSAKNIFRRKSQISSQHEDVDKLHNSDSLKANSQPGTPRHDSIWHEKLKYDEGKEMPPEPKPIKKRMSDICNVEKEEIIENNIVIHLATRKTRTNSLYVKIMLRSGKDDLEQRNILHNELVNGSMESAICCLRRRLSLRPEREILVSRNYVRQYSEQELLRIKEELKSYLNEKLQNRPTVEKLIEKKILRFDENVCVTTTIDYDRRAEKPWIGLSNRQKANIRKELNDFKLYEMEVHEESKKFTRFH